VASSSKVVLSKMPVPYVAVPSNEHKVSRIWLWYVFIK
jgi:hypothetical protein